MPSCLLCNPTTLNERTFICHRHKELNEVFHGSTPSAEFGPAKKKIQNAINFLKQNNIQAAAKETGSVFKWIQDFYKKNTQEVPGSELEEALFDTSKEFDTYGGSAGGVGVGDSGTKGFSTLSGLKKAQSGPRARPIDMTKTMHEPGATEKAGSGLKALLDKIKSGLGLSKEEKEYYFQELIKMLTYADQNLDRNDVQGAASWLGKSFYWIRNFKIKNTAEVPDQEAGSTGQMTNVFGGQSQSSSNQSSGPSKAAAE